MLTRSPVGTRLITKTYQDPGRSFPDTETTIEFTPGGTGPQTITARTRCLPSSRSWSRPPADELRAWVDELLDGTGWHRTGRLKYRKKAPTNMWLTDFTVERTPVERKKS